LDLLMEGSGDRLYLLAHCVEAWPLGLMAEQPTAMSAN
jgi:hypothetical protein